MNGIHYDLICPSHPSPVLRSSRCRKPGQYTLHTYASAHIPFKEVYLETDSYYFSLLIKTFEIVLQFLTQSATPRQNRDVLSVAASFVELR